MNATPEQVMSRLYHQCGRLEFEIILRPDVSPPSLYESLGMGVSQADFSCDVFSMGYASQEDETGYLQVPAALRTLWVAQQELEHTGQRLHLRPNVAMRLPAVTLFTLVLWSLGLPHHWILWPLGTDGLVDEASPLSQASLLSSGITMAQLARDLEQLPASLVLRRRVKLVVGLEPIMMLKPVPTASIVFRITHIPKQGHPGWGLGQDEKPPCLVTKYPRVDGAHLVDNKYQAYFPEVMWALDDALQTPPASMATYFGVVARGLTETLRDASLADETPIMTSDNDVIPLDRSTHGLFDQHSLLFSPFGDGSWVWLSAAWPMPISIIAALEAQSDPFEGVKRQLRREITTAPSMLASAIKVVLQAFGTDALKAAYKALAWTLKTRVSPRQPSSSSRRTDPSSSRSQQSAQRSISSSSGPVRDARRSLGGLPTSGSSKRLSALSSSSRRSSRFLQDSMSLPPSDPPGSPQEFWDELEQHQPQEEKPSNTTASSSSSDPSGGTSNGSNWNASSSRGTKDTPDTSAESEGKTLAPITTSAAQEELGQVAESVREGVDEEENLWDQAANFDELWAEENDVGRVGTKQQRKAANLLDYFSQLEFEEVEGSESSENGDEDNDGLIGVPLRTYKRAQKLCEDKNNRISASEERALREALTLIKTQGELDELLDDRYKASFYMSFPTLVTRYKFAAVE